MINRNELRIGNLVEEKVLGYCKVDTILRKTAQVSKDESQSYSIDIENLLPIPLTPELLIKCGFKHQDGSYFIIEKYDEEFEGIRNAYDFSINFYNGEYQLMNGCGDTEYVIGRTFNYLHELQNLFHALTNEELCVVL
jgi:hypothetical protein